MEGEVRISITGPESTGKSVLAKQLAEHYRTLWVPEYSREYLDDLGRPYGYEDIAIIAKGQLEKENRQAANCRGILFCDTDFLVTLIWSRFKYGKCDPWIEEMVNSHRYDLYLLCDIDLPWEFDALRENPGERKQLFGLYHGELERMNVNFAVVSGTGSDRLRNAILAIEERLTL
jgi:NadR type nicotinamide-nucleotide adenylyltransferase